MCDGQWPPRPIQTKEKTRSRPLTMRLHCAPMNLSGTSCYAVTTGTLHITNAIGIATGSPYGPLHCPANTMAVGANLRAGEVLNRYGLICSDVNKVILDMN